MTSGISSTELVTTTRRQEIFVSWTTDILTYIVILNLFVEYNPKVVIDSFTISILTAILLKILLEIILRFEHRVGEFFESRPGRFSNYLRIASTLIILFLSKFLILEVVDIVFGEHVELGKFIDVIILVIALIATREVVHRIFQSLGERDATVD